MPPDPVRTLIEHAVATREEADRRIAGASVGWPLERMAVVDRIVLRMAVAEVLDPDGPPTAVVIDGQWSWPGTRRVRSLRQRDPLDDRQRHRPALTEPLHPAEGRRRGQKEPQKSPWWVLEFSWLSANVPRQEPLGRFHLAKGWHGGGRFAGYMAAAVTVAFVGVFGTVSSSGCRGAVDGPGLDNITGLVGLGQLGQRRDATERRCAEPRSDVPLPEWLHVPRRLRGRQQRPHGLGPGSLDFSGTGFSGTYTLSGQPVTLGVAASPAPCRRRCRCRYS